MPTKEELAEAINVLYRINADSLFDGGYMCLGGEERSALAVAIKRLEEDIAIANVKIEFK